LPSIDTLFDGTDPLLATNPSVVALRAKAIARLWETVGEAEARLNRLIEAYAQARRRFLRVLPGGGKP
jgi:hypothetical protein